MLRKSLLIVLVTLSLTSCSLGDIGFGKQAENHSKSHVSTALKSQIADDFIPTDIQIVSIGDSLTQGVGDSRDRGGYIPYLESYIEQNRGIKQANISNYGIRGNRTNHLLARLSAPELMEDMESADAIIITIGGNDIMKVVRDRFTKLTVADFKRESKGYEERLKEIFSIIRQRNDKAEIYFVGLYNPFGKWMPAFQELDLIMNEWNNISENIVAEDTNAYYIPIEDIFSETEENLLFKEDYFHPNDKGYELIASRIYKQLKLFTVKDINILVNAGEGNMHEQNNE